MTTSRLDAGAFSASDIQTMARVIDLPVDKVRRLTELAVFVAGLDRDATSRPAALDVERLAQAIHSFKVPPDTSEADAVCHEIAERIAAEYARLASEPE